MREFLSKTILDAGALALDWFHKRESLAVQSKDAKDIVSQADLDVERFIRETTQRQYPDFGFYGEESGKHQGLGSRRRFIVDPIDGTVSFLRGHSYWTISMAIEIDREITLGAVFAPVLNELFLAQKGQGALKNNRAICVSQVTQLKSAVVATGFACLRSNLSNNNLPRFNRVVSTAMSVRIRGSAALDLCKVAEGEIDLFWEQHLNLYDVAAGALILQEAGGKLSDFKGHPVLDPEEVVGSNALLHTELLTLL